MASSKIENCTVFAVNLELEIIIGSGGSVLYLLLIYQIGNYVKKKFLIGLAPLKFKTRAEFQYLLTIYRWLEVVRLYCICY